MLFWVSICNLSTLLFSIHSLGTVEGTSLPALSDIPLWTCCPLTGLIPFWPCWQHLPPQPLAAVSSWVNSSLHEEIFPFLCCRAISYQFHWLPLVIVIGIWFHFHLIHHLGDSANFSHIPQFSPFPNDESQPFQCCFTRQLSSPLLIWIFNWIALPIWKLKPPGLFLSSL